MSLNAAAIAVMVDRGMTAADILAVAEALEIKRDRTGAERQARYRERKATRNGVTRDVTRDAPPKESIQTPPDSPTKPNGLEPPKAKSSIKRPLPVNWQPAPLKPDGEAGRIVAAWQPGRIERELSKFKDHALAGRVLHSDWDAAWRNWIKKADEFDERYSRKQSILPLGKTSAAIAGLGDWNDDRPM